MKTVLILITALVSLSFLTRPDRSKRILAEAKQMIKNPHQNIMLALIEVESKGNTFAMRYEPRLQKKYKWPKAWAYSYGLTQVVYGFHKDRCGLKDPRELFEPRKNIACGLRVYKDCLAAKKSVSGALNCYNGDRTGRYAKLVLSKLGD